jgi:hypothetical protein
MPRANRYSSTSGAVTGIVPCNLTTRPPFSIKLETASAECMFRIPQNRSNWTLTGAPQKPDGGGRGGRVLPVLGSPLGKGAPSTSELWLSLRRVNIGPKTYIAKISATLRGCSELARTSLANRVAHSGFRVALREGKGESDFLFRVLVFRGRVNPGCFDARPIAVGSLQEWQLMATIRR